jgi:DNA-binding NarL/FixJ family response regulator
MAERVKAARVLVGDFGAIGAVGLRIMLDAEGVEFETSGPTAGDVLASVVPGETEVVVLDREMPDAVTAAARLAAEHPEVRVIVCSLDDTTMWVYPGDIGAAYGAPLDPPRLAAVIGGRR